MSMKPRQISRMSSASCSRRLRLSPMEPLMSTAIPSISSCTFSGLTAKQSKVKIRRASSTRWWLTLQNIRSYVSSSDCGNEPCTLSRWSSLRGHDCKDRSWHSTHRNLYAFQSKFSHMTVFELLFTYTPCAPCAKVFWILSWYGDSFRSLRSPLSRPDIKSPISRSIPAFDIVTCWMAGRSRDSWMSGSSRLVTKRCRCPTPHCRIVPRYPARILVVHFEDSRRAHPTRCTHGGIVESSVEDTQAVLMMKVYRLCVIYAATLDLHNRLEAGSIVVVVGLATWTIHPFSNHR